ncbi:MAG: hypothetical protein KHZ58_15020 [Hungatella hathewayi]|nr:hypothetical protein [Hungatella hathewayi]
MTTKEYDFRIRALTEAFYHTYPDPPFKEILKKKRRAYNCLLLPTQDTFFICIPYRTEIAHPYAYHFTSSLRSREHKSGLDYTKMVLIRKKEFIADSDTVIDQDEYVETRNNIDRIQKEAFQFLDDYRNHQKGVILLHKSEFERRYKFSPLKYFHKEMEIEDASKELRQ